MCCFKAQTAASLLFPLCNNISEMHFTCLHLQDLLQSCELKLLPLSSHPGLAARTRSCCSPPAPTPTRSTSLPTEAPPSAPSASSSPSSHPWTCSSEACLSPRSPAARARCPPPGTWACSETCWRCPDPQGLDLLRYLSSPESSLLQHAGMFAVIRDVVAERLSR